MQNLRIGQGYDCHRFAENRRLVLGGVEIPHPLGLEGHSDADALTHAVCDALLGAAALGDIGSHFPDNDPAYKNIDSLRLLERVVEALAENHYRVLNVDATVVCEQPRLLPHIPAMQHTLTPILAASGGPGVVSIKATTNEKMGFLGRGEGLAALAVALIAAD